MAFLFFIELNRLLALQTSKSKLESAADSALSVEFGLFEVLNDKGVATKIQRLLAQWMISLRGLSYKSIKLDTVKEMLRLLVDVEDLLGIGSSCTELLNRYAVGFNTIAKMAKLAAGLCMIVH